MKLTEYTGFKNKKEAEKKLKELGKGYSLSCKTHMCMDIKGFLRNKENVDLTGYITEKNGALWTDKMVRDHYQDCLNKGWAVIPLGECDNFDYQDGCQGHDIVIKKA